MYISKETQRVKIIDFFFPMFFLLKTRFNCFGGKFRIFCVVVEIKFGPSLTVPVIFPRCRRGNMPRSTASRCFHLTASAGFAVDTPPVPPQKEEPDLGTAGPYGPTTSYTWRLHRQLIYGVKTRPYRTLSHES